MPAVRLSVPRNMYATCQSNQSKQCDGQTDGQTARQTEGQTDNREGIPKCKPAYAGNTIWEMKQQLMKVCSNHSSS